MSFNDIDALPDFELLKEALKKPLPGYRAHQALLPPGRPLLLHDNQYANALHSAVMILLYKDKDAVYICLTQRSSFLKHHAGQISFPGGKTEPGENHPSEAALREAREEIGIDPHQVHFAGLLTELHIPVSGFIVQPVVFWAGFRPLFHANPAEVERVLLFPLSEFIGNQNRSKAKVETRQGDLVVPCYRVEGHIIWGATAMMLAELAMVLIREFRFLKAKH
jgi:8-oxo-dGTP pyrophosphatase MutT (NUDIX family)